MTALMSGSSTGAILLLPSFCLLTRKPMSLLLMLTMIQHSTMPLQWPCRYGNVPLQQNKELASPRNHYGRTAFDFAKLRNHKQIGRLLVTNRMLENKVLRYLTVNRKNESTPPAWPLLPREVAEKILEFRWVPIGSDAPNLHEVIELCKKVE